MAAYPPPPSQPAEPHGYQQGPYPVGYRPEAPGKGLATGSLVTGIVGVVFGLIPFLFLISLTCGIVALVLGLISRSKGKRVGVKQGRAGAILGAVALALGVVGLVIVTNAFEDFGEDMDCLSEADTPAEIDACN